MALEEKKFWNILKAIAKLFDFTVVISFEDGKVVDFDIRHNTGVLESEV